eukprot:scaffold143_cov260-Pinguiococcus_pyrenoidosus.AAC.17
MSESSGIDGGRPRILRVARLPQYFYGRQCRPRSSPLVPTLWSLPVHRPVVHRDNLVGRRAVPVGVALCHR